jgi:hypothetical protein
MDFAKQIVSLGAALIALVVLIYVLWIIITSLYSGGISIIIALIVIIFFIFIFIKKGLDL